MGPIGVLYFGCLDIIPVQKLPKIPANAALKDIVHSFQNWFAYSLVLMQPTAKLQGLPLNALAGYGKIIHLANRTLSTTNSESYCSVRKLSFLLNAPTHVTAHAWNDPSTS